MAEPIKISTNKYIKNGKVDIDGNIWNIVLPGAGTEMRFSQASRACKLSSARVSMIDKKIENGTATEADLDAYEQYSAKYEENEKIIYETFLQVFNDDTDDNSEVRKWIEDTPTSVLMMAFEDIKGQADGKQPKTEQ